MIIFNFLYFLSLLFYAIFRSLQTTTPYPVILGQPQKPGSKYHLCRIRDCIPFSDTPLEADCTKSIACKDGRNLEGTLNTSSAVTYVRFSYNVVDTGRTPNDFQIPGLFM